MGKNVLAIGQITLSNINVQYTHIRYSASSDGTNFSETPNKYIGIYTGTSKTAPTNKSEYSWSQLTGNTGTSVSVSSTSTTYQTGTSNTTKPTGNWTTSIPTTDATNKYLWTKVIVTFTDGKTAEMYSVSSTMDSIQIGGRNLFRKGWLTGTAQKVYDEETDIYTITYNGNSYGTQFKNDCIEIPFGSTYTVSMDILYAKDTIVWIDNNEKSTGTIEYTGNDITENRVVVKRDIKANEWSKVVYRASNTSLRAENKSIYIYDSFKPVVIEENETFKVRHIMIQLGNIETDWTPAPEDVDDAIKSDKPVINGTHVTNTYSWTGDAPFSQLKDGQKITYWLPYNVGGNQVSMPYWKDENGETVQGTNNGTVLNLKLSDGTYTGNIACYYGGNTRLTSHFGQANSIELTYKKLVKIGNYYYTGWWANANYNTDTIDDRIAYFSGKTGSVGIWANSLFMEDAYGTYQNICTASDGTVKTDNRTVETTKKKNTHGFKIAGNIYYTNTSYNANTNIDGWGAVYSGYGNIFDARYSFNVSLGNNILTPYASIYLVGTIKTDGLFYLDDTWWTQTPNIKDKIYILIGAVYDSNTSNVRINLYKDNPWYTYNQAEGLVDYNYYQTKVLYNQVAGVKSIVDDVEKSITDEVWKNTKYNVYDIDGNLVQKNIEEYSATVKTDLSGITSKVSDVESILGEDGDSPAKDGTIFARVSEAQQTADKIEWLVKAGSTSSSLTLTDNALTAITNNVIIKDPTGSETIINGGKISANSISSSILKTDAIKSSNYIDSTDKKFSVLGTYLDLSNGELHMPNFYSDSAGNAYFNGQVKATSGYFGTDDNAWFIGEGTIGGIYNSDNALIDDVDYSFLTPVRTYKDANGETKTDNTNASINIGKWNILANSPTLNIRSGFTTLNGGNFITNGLTGDDLYYYDYGMVEPSFKTNDYEWNKNFLYVRRAKTKSTIQGEWEYLFRVTRDGSVYYKNQLLAGENGTGAMFLSLTGGTISGNLTVTGTLTATADKANKDGNGNTITTTYHKLAGTNTNSATNTFSGDNTFSKSSGFNFSGIEQASSNSNRPVWFSYAGQNGVPVYNPKFQYNPYTDILTVGSITGIAEKANKDSEGNIIKDTYAKIVDSNFIGTTNAEQIYADDIHAESLIVNGDARFVNTIQGNVTGIEDYNDKKTVKFGYSTSGMTSASWLASWDASVSGEYRLRAISPSNITVGKANLLAPSYETNLTTSFGNWTNNKISSNGKVVWGQQWVDTSLSNDSGNLTIWLEPNSDKTMTTVNMIVDGKIYASSGFEGNLNGNASTATTATSANKLNSNAGNSTTPIYFSNGVPVAMSYTLEKSVPSNAVFTDTVTTASTTGSGNAVTAITANNGALTVTKGSTFVDTSSNQIIGGTKTFSNPNNVLYETSVTANITPNVDSLSNPPWNADLYHDHFAFLKYHTIESQEYTENGTDWIDDNKSIVNLFMQREGDSGRTVVLRENESAYRFILKNSSFGYSGANWYEIAVGYTNPFSNFEVKIEYSTDGETYTEIHKSTVTSNSAPYFFRNKTGYTADGYLRFTFTKLTNLETGSVVFHCIKALCTRKGSQGLGSEYEYPYEWDANQNIYPDKTNVRNLGTSSRKWSNVYATTFRGALDGNASTASKASKVIDSNNNTSEISITYSKAGQTSTSWLASWNGYELGAISPSNVSVGKVNGHTVNSDVPSNAVFTDTTYNEATTSTAGLLSASDKSKLDSITVSDIGTVGANSIVGEKGISSTIKNGVATIGHSQNAITAVSNAYGGTSTGTASSTLSFGGKFAIPYVTYDTYGHVTGKGETILALPSAPTSVTGSAGSATNDSAGNNISTTYLKKSGDTMSGDLNFSTNSSLYWNSDTYRQRITIRDDADKDTAVFTFQQSENGGSSFNDLMTIKDNGTVVANNFTGNLTGNATSASTATTASTLLNARNITIGNATKSFNGSSDISYTNAELGMNYKDIAPLTSKKYTGIYSLADNDANNYFFYGKIVPTSYKALWRIKLKIHAYVPTNADYNAVYIFEISGMRNTYSAYSAWNTIQNTSYRPIWYQTLRYATNETNALNTGHLIGVSLTSAPNRTSTSYKRDFEIELLETENCEFSFFDNMSLIANVPNSANYSTSNSNYNATDNGLKETGDDNTYDRTYMGNNYIYNKSSIRMQVYPIFGMDRNGNAQGISNYSSGYTGGTTSVNTARVYNTNGMDTSRGLFYHTNWLNYDKNQLISTSIFFACTAIDLRYSDNCWYSYNPCNFAMEQGKPVYLRGVIGSDGLFYLRPFAATQIIVQGYYKDSNTFVTSSGGTTNINNYTSLQSYVVYQDITSSKYYRYSGGTFTEVSSPDTATTNKYQKTWTQEIPTSVEKDSNGSQYVYMLIGNPYVNGSYVNGGYQINLLHKNPIYWYHNGRFEEYIGHSESADHAEIATSATSASKLIYQSSRLTSQDAIDSFMEKGTFKVGVFQTSSENNIGMASNDGMLLSLPWDNSTNYGIQLAIDDATTGTMKIRGKTSTWGDWYTFLHSGNYSTWASPKAGSSYITTVGTITSGTWNGSKITNTYLANSSITLGTTSVSLGSTASSISGLASINATDYISVNSSGAGNNGGLSLYGTGSPTTYGIAMRNKANSGTHGYTTGDWATYFYMTGQESTHLTRGWIFKDSYNNTNIASISNAGNMALNGSIALGCSGTTKPVEMVYDDTNKCLNFVFN